MFEQLGQIASLMKNLPKMKEEMSAIFDKGLYTELIILMDKHFGTHSYSLSNLFRDEQRIVGELLPALEGQRPCGDCL